MNKRTVLIHIIVFLILLIAVGGFIFFKKAPGTKAAVTPEKKAESSVSEFSMAERQKQDKHYQEAVEYLKTADLSKPTAKMAEKAAYAADINAIETIYKNGFRDWKNPDIIIKAATYGTVELIEKLISYGADIKAKDEYGFTALHWAALGGNIEMVKYLESKGLDIKAKNKYGTTALDYARTDEIKTYLKSKGAVSGKK